MCVKKLNSCAAVFVALIVASSVNASASSQNSTRKYKRGSVSRKSMPKRHYIIASNTTDESLKYKSTRASLNQNELRSWEFRTAPIALLARWYTLDVSYRFTEHIAVGPSVVIYDAPGEQGNMLAPTYKGNAFGLHANYYFTSVERNSWYSGLHAYQESYTSYPEGYPGHEDRKGFRSNVTAGYQIKWSRVNLMTGLGMAYRNHDIIKTSRFDDTETESRESQWNPTVEVKLGFEI
jgi:hypothetical protein